MSESRCQDCMALQRPACTHHAWKVLQDDKLMQEQPDIWGRRTSSLKKKVKEWVGRSLGNCIIGGFGASEVHCLS